MLAEPDELTRQAVVTVRGRSFLRDAHPLLAAAAAEFVSGFEEGTLRLFDLVLPQCRQMVDFGAYVGFTALYAATQVHQVHAFEPSGANHALLLRNMAANPGLAPRIALHRHGIGAHDEDVVLFAKGAADSGASIFREVERDRILAGRVEGMIHLRNAADVLREIGLDRRTLVKMDIEGAEYQVLPAIVDQLAEYKPWLQVSFHPFNLVATDPYRTALQRLRASLAVAEALACYRFIHLYDEGDWFTITPADRMDFLRQYLVKPKPVPRVASPQYGFVGALVFADEPLPTRD